MPRRIRTPAAFLLLAAIAAAPLSLAGCSDDEVTNPPPGNTETITILQNAATLGAGAYSPNPDTVAVGTTVRWVNNDNIPHTATSDTPGLFDVSVPAGGSGSFRFDAVGTYGYHCKVTGHSMTGTVVVTP